MNWLNVKTSVGRAPEYVGSEPVQRATWWNVMLYAVEQENGGRIKGARLWKCRQWQQTCGVTADEVMGAGILFSWEGDDLVLWGYPIERETEVRTNRDSGRLGGQAVTTAKIEAARANGAKGGRPKKETQAETQNNPTENPPKNPRSESETQDGAPNRVNPSGNPTEGNGRGKERKVRESAGLRPIPIGLSQQEGFADEWDAFRDHRKKLKKPLTDRAEELILKTLSIRPEDSVAGLQMALVKGWQGFDWQWFDNSKDSQPAANGRGVKRIRQEDLI